MLTGYFAASSAMDAFQTSIDNTSNNLANMNTTAFKRNVTSYQDYSYTGANNLQVGTGVRVSSISPTGFTQGTIESTGRDTDVAINGNGFFPVQLPDGTIQYTRDGSLHRDDTGRLVTSAGYAISPTITIPSDTTKITIAPDGTVSVLTSSSPNVPKTLGQIPLASFINPEGLKLQSGNLYSDTPASGPATISTAGTSGVGTMIQASLELSNVDVTTELTTLVASQQAFTANSKVLNTTNQMVTQAFELIH